MTTSARLTVWVSGRVQGVGFRWWARDQAAALGLTGSATNLADGRVEVVVEGPEDACQTMLTVLRGGRTPGRVSAVVERWGEVQGLNGFTEG
jgi:acylphosphatase